jgi:hypothetical protein
MSRKTNDRPGFKEKVILQLLIKYISIGMCNLFFETHLATSLAFRNVPRAVSSHLLAMVVGYTENYN